MTRMQKWQSYRDEIAKQSLIGESIDADEKNLRRYKTEIDKINPEILASITDQSPSLLKGVSNVEISQTQISTKIADMFTTINKAANTINKDNVETIFWNLRNDKIVDKNNKFDEAKLLEACPEYRLFRNETKSLDIQNKDANEMIKKDLQNKYTNFTSPNKEHKVDRVITINKNVEKQASHYVFVISISVSILLLLILVSLFIAKVVIG